MWVSNLCVMLSVVVISTESVACTTIMWVFARGGLTGRLTETSSVTAFTTWRLWVLWRSARTVAADSPTPDTRIWTSLLDRSK